MKQGKESWVWGTGENGYKKTRKWITAALDLVKSGRGREW